MPDNNEYYKTYLGALFSVLTLIFMLSYGAFKFTDFWNYKNYQLSSIVNSKAFEVREPLDIVNYGFNVAATVASYDDEISSIVEDPEIGTIKFYLKTWDIS